MQINVSGRIIAATSDGSRVELRAHDPGKCDGDDVSSRPAADRAPLIRGAASLALTVGNRGGVHRARPVGDDRYMRGERRKPCQRAAFVFAGDRSSLPAAVGA